MLKCLSLKYYPTGDRPGLAESVSLMPLMIHMQTFIMSALTSGQQIVMHATLAQSSERNEVKVKSFKSLRSLFHCDV